MGKKNLKILLVTLTVMLVPSIALASGMGEGMFESLGSRLWTVYLKPSLIPYANGIWEQGPWLGWLVSLVIFGLTMTWVLGLRKELRHEVGRLGGIGPLPIAFDMAWMILGMAFGMTLGTFTV